MLRVPIHKCWKRRNADRAIQFKFTNWVSDCCLTPNKKFFNYVMVRTSYIWLDDDDVCFVLDQHLSWIFIVLTHWNNSQQVDMSLISWNNSQQVARHVTNLMKQQSAGRHVTNLMKQQSAGRHVTNLMKQSAGRHVTNLMKQQSAGRHVANLMKQVSR
jgi:hypothetical protein